MPFTLFSGVIPHLYIWKVNTWGYSTINFFAPMSRYASAGGGPVAASKGIRNGKREKMRLFTYSRGRRKNGGKKKKGKIERKKRKEIQRKK
jgi:hypothetical protein